ncbi:MAG: hypothetical protein JWO33_441 [Caulobacteraceae bacterium]|nr:hypothetical protein [Caulobacteraceae bacterium]
MTATIDYATAYPHGLPRHRLAGAIRYALVLAVWLGLFALRPRLAIRIFRERRADSPIPRLGG